MKIWGVTMMRKAYLIMVIISLVMVLSACSKEEKNIEVKEGIYNLSSEEVEDSSWVPTIELKDGQFTFDYDWLSSYLSHGAYEVKGDKVMLITEDEKYHYVFRCEGNSLYFNKLSSSSVKLTDKRLGTQILNNSEFILQTNE